MLTTSAGAVHRGVGRLLGATVVALLLGLSSTATRSMAIVALQPGVGGLASNGFITTPDLDPIFSQASFQPNPIDIRWLSPWMPVISPTLATIDSQDELNALFALAPPPQGVFVDVFFVHDILWCNGVAVPGHVFVGCGETGGPGSAFRIAVDSDFIPGASGDEILAHELGHNLGLGAAGDPSGVQHVLPDNCTNLMNATICDGNQALTAAQVGRLRGDTDLIGGTAQQGFFINLLPIAILAAPEPSALALIGLGLAGLCLRRPRRAPCHRASANRRSLASMDDTS